MPTSVRLPKETEERLEALAKNTGRSKAFYIRQAIQEHLEDLEDAYLAQQRLEELRAGRSRTLSLSDLERDLGLAD